MARHVRWGKSFAGLAHSAACWTMLCRSRPLLSRRPHLFRSAGDGYSFAMTTERSPWSDRKAPSLEEFEALAQEAFRSLPSEFRSLVGDVTFVVAEFAEDDVLEELEAASPFDIMGLFQEI